MTMNAFNEWRAGMAPSSIVGLAAGGVLILALGAGLLWWAMREDYAPLFSDLADADAAEVAAALDEAAVPYRISPDGRLIEVPAAQVHRTRMRLVGEGVPTGGHVGLELFDESDFGVTEFAQHVNLQRALQGELERTIGTLEGVEAVRVHLTLSRSSGLLRDRDPSKASVALRIAPGASLGTRQVLGIQRLVAAAVDGLPPEQVVVVDQQGQSIGGSGAAGGGLQLAYQLDEQAAIEARVRARVADLLAQGYPVEAWRLAVDVQLNFDSVREVREMPVATGADGASLVLRQRTNTTRMGGGNGVAAAPERGQEGEDVEYALGRDSEEVTRAPGRIERITVALLLSTPLAEGEAERLRQLIEAAVGLRADRGDRLEIVSLAGEVPRAAVMPEGDAVAADVADGGEAPVDAAIAHDDAEPATPAGLPVAARRAEPAPWTLPGGLWPWAGGLGVVLLLAVLAIALRGGDRRTRLTPAERDQALQRVRAWLDASGAQP